MKALSLRGPATVALLIGSALGCGSNHTGSQGIPGGATTTGTSTGGGAAASGSSGSIATEASTTTAGSAGGASGAVTTGAEGTSAGNTDSGGAANSAAGGLSSTGDVTASSTQDGAGNAGGSGGSSVGGAPCLEFGEPEMVGTIANDALPGPSGLAASRAHLGVLYAHADRGSAAEFFAFDESGADLGSYALAGVTTNDWEDIAVGPGPAGTFVFLADIGDNAARTGGTPRSEIQIYRVPEPAVSVGQAPVSEDLDGWEVLRFVYPEQAHDAETLIVDPVTQDLVIVTKEDDGDSRVYRAAGDTPLDTATELEEIGSYQVPGSGQALQVSAGDASPSGDRVILRTYEAIYLWPRAAGANLGPTFDGEPVLLPSPSQPQSEGLAFAGDGSAWFSAGEQEMAIYRGNATCP